LLNHVRTLLRNTNPEPYAGQDGQELVDPSFRSVALPASLHAVRTILFGRRPDRTALDLKLRRYMAVLHATGLAAYVTAKDARITYPAPLRNVLEFRFDPQIAPLHGHAYPLYLGGDPPAEDGSGALEYVWSVVVRTTTSVAVARIQPNPRDVLWPVIYSDGLGTPFILPGAGFQCRFHADVPVDTGWVVACLARPAMDLGAVLAALDGLDETVQRALFGTTGDEPYCTWKALWDSPNALPYRLGAILLALAARTDELRK
jgi:hypothetical protein